MAKPKKLRKRKTPRKPTRAKPVKKAKPAKRKPAKPAKRKPAKPAKRKPVKPAKPAKRKPPKPAKRKRKPSKPVFEGRLRKPPPEFKLHVAAATQDEAYASILARLQDARDALPDPLTGRVIVHPYADGSVDGELYVKVPEGWESGEVGWNLYQAFGKLSVGNRYWVSIGARYIIEKDDEIYRRFKGMNQVQANYQRANQANIAEEYLILDRKVLPGMQEHYEREAHSIFIRLHWNPADEHPKR